MYLLPILSPILVVWLILERQELVLLHMFPEQTASFEYLTFWQYILHEHALTH